jgi:hypothetical protein
MVKKKIIYSIMCNLRPSNYDGSSYILIWIPEYSYEIHQHDNCSELDYTGNIDIIWEPE